MRKLIPLLIFLLCGSTASLNAQIADQKAREAEWKAYSLPQTSFTRHVTPEKSLVFRAPADWKQLGSMFHFTGPHEGRIAVSTQTVPDGYPLTEYVAAILKQISGATGSTSESILTRRTQFQDLEAREIHYESRDDAGNVYRTTIWVTISGPLVFNVSMTAPVEHAAALEPFFKATVQSVMFVPAKFAEFDTARSSAIKTPAPVPVHEVQNIVASLNELNSNREAAINRLMSLFASQPDFVVDLLVDRRAIVRSAAAEALARSKNAALKPLLWHILDDSDPFVAEAASRRLAQEIDIAAQLLNRSWTTNASEKFARVWPFMSKENRGKLIQGLLSQTTPDRKSQIGGLSLLSTMPADEFKLPLARIIASNHDPMTIVALQVATSRGESLPVETLLKLAASGSDGIKKLAVEALGHSATIPDIPRLEALLSKPSATVYMGDKAAAAARKALEEETKLSIKKIRFRNDLSLAKDRQQVREIIRKASSDPTLDDFAWRYDCELTIPGCAPATPSRNLPPDFKVKPFAENLFPQKVTHYTAIPNPEQSVQRFHQTLHGLQLDSPRAQANLIWVMGRVREGLGQGLGAPPEAVALIDYTGIKPDSPIVLGGWSAPGAPESVSIAQRRAIVLRVKDRERFERIVENFQQSMTLFTNLTDYVAIGTRAAAALPAFLPFSAQAALSVDPVKVRNPDPVSQSVIGQTEWNGIPIKSIEHRWIDDEWQLTSASTYVTFIGDVAILTSDVATIRELLSNATIAEPQLLAGNEDFRRAVATDADVVYFSDLKAVFADPNDKSLTEIKKASENGALRFSNSMWENSHRIDFDESDWSKPLLPFHPKDLSAPRELLPSSTLAYYLMKVDIPSAWQTWPKTMNIRDNRFEVDPARWSDFKKEVLPELGPECGAVLLELPDFYEDDPGESTEGVWAAFCKLKSNKLADALAAGKLFRNVGPTTDNAEIKSGETSYFVGVKNGFLVVSNSTKGLAAMGGKTNLAATRDYSRAAEKVPAQIIAFGGYNLEAAVAAASSNASDGLRAQMAGMIFSIASAFHSQSFFATATAGAIEGRSSVAMDREGRYAVADFSYLPRGVNITYATLEPHGLPILDQKRLSNIVLKVRAKAPGPIDNIKDDIKSATQAVEQKSPNELVVTVAARRPGPEKKIQLPVTNAEVAAFLKSTVEISSDHESVIAQARQIAGEDRDAWSVAQKLADWTYKNLEWKSVARAGAAETLATREADCSEFSQLYVSMARSLGLPARIVSGLAYSGNSFGGHAWVEVWIGEWIELDPTWGTHFVDATHIRNQSSTLVTAAALNLIDLEVMETRRTVAEFQKNPRALAEQLVKAIASADQSEIEASFDLATLTDEFMGAGAWTALKDNERDQLSLAYRRVVNEIVETYGEEGEPAGNVHLLHLAEKGERAEALCYVSDQDLLLRLRLLRRADVWYLVDVVQPDPGFHLAAERFGPVIKSIEASRAGKKPEPGLTSNVMKVLALIDSDAKVKA
ncbi:MAG TPA: transglutaminase domain-containing protein, partial [Pyrinomonadaceae bacterium]|nr:transglutaminase domain-containing protein [Pyrinomonadaceae bacterium]